MTSRHPRRSVIGCIPTTKGCCEGLHLLQARSARQPFVSSKARPQWKKERKGPYEKDSYTGVKKTWKPVGALATSQCNFSWLHKVFDWVLATRLVLEFQSGPCHAQGLSPSLRPAHGCPLHRNAARPGLEGFIIAEHSSEIIKPSFLSGPCGASPRADCRGCVEN